MDSYSMTVRALCNVHCHLREGKDLMRDLIALAVKGGADVLAPMPNTKDGLTTAAMVLKYCDIAKECVQPEEVTFLPIMMINEYTSSEDIKRCFHGGIDDCKVYPLNRTTKSHNGVRHYSRLIKIIRECGELGIKCHFHPEHPWNLFSNRDAEFVFLSTIDMFMNETNATIIWEHGTDARCIPYWKEMAQSKRFFVTITAHHLVADEDGEFGDVRSVCKPPIKTYRDRYELVRFVKENHSWVMAGPDDAPHDRATKHPETGCCSCGAYTAPFLLQLYAHALNPANDNLAFENFVSRNARDLHGLPPSTRKITLVKKPFQIPLSYQVGPWTVEPFWAGKTIDWSLG